MGDWEHQEDLACQEEACATLNQFIFDSKFRLMLDDEFAAVFEAAQKFDASRNSKIASKVSKAPVQQKKLKVIEAERRSESLSVPLDTSNKGFQLLHKMSWQFGSFLSKKAIESQLPIFSLRADQELDSANIARA